MTTAAEQTTDIEREPRIERIAADLLPRASQLTRLVVRRATAAGAPLSRTEGGILRTLSEGERRITELAGSRGSHSPRRPRSSSAWKSGDSSPGAVTPPTDGSRSSR